MMKTILATAYAVNPYKGSEDGTGWNLVGQIARHNKVIVVTRENNRPFIEKYLNEHTEVVQNINATFLYFDLPYWMRFWKKGERGAMLYFYLWQLFMPLFVYRSGVKFDIAHNLNFHNDWTPTFLWGLGKPLVWGPVGHHPNTPKEYVVKPYGKKEYFKSSCLWLLKNMFWNLDPFLQIGLLKADKVICMNSGVEKVHFIIPDKVVRMPAVSAAAPLNNTKINADGKFVILSVGRLVPMKGFDITIAAFAEFYKMLTEEQKNTVQLKIVGKGPLLEKVRSDIFKLGIENAVDLCEWVEKEKMDEIYRQASLFFFPSHEGAGMVVPEALAYGLPVLCFDNEGPGEFIDSSCGMKIPYSSYNESISAFALLLKKMVDDKFFYEELSAGALRKFTSSFDWNVKGEVLKTIYDNLIPVTLEKNYLRPSFK